MAFEMGNKFNCPWCKDVDNFQENVLCNGIFIPSFNDNANPITKPQQSDDAPIDAPNTKRAKRSHKN